MNYHRAPGCEGKSAFSTREKAEVSRSKFTSRKTVYRCSFCSAWHVGNTTQRPAAASSTRAQALFNIRALDALTSD